MFIKTLDLRPIAADHIIINSLDTLRYIRLGKLSARNLYGKVLKGKVDVQCTRVWLYVARLLFSLKYHNKRDTKFEKYTQYVRF